MSDPIAVAVTRIVVAKSGDPAWGARLAAEAARDAASSSASAAAADRAQTGLDRTAVAADRTQTGADRTAAAASASAAATSAANAAAAADVAAPAYLDLMDRRLAEVYIKPSASDDASWAAAQSTVAANAALGQGTRIILRDRATYTLTQARTFDATAGLTIEGNHAFLDFSGGGTSAVMLDAAGTETTIGTLSADAAAGASTLTLTTTSGLASGDLVTLQGAANSWATGCSVGEMVRILAVDSGTQVTLQTALAYAYTAAAPTTVKKLAGQPLLIENLRAKGRASSSASQGGIKARLVPAVLRGVDLDGFDNYGITLSRVPGGRVSDSRVRNARAAGLAYGIAYESASRNLTFVGNHFEEVRHGITGGGSQGVNVDIVAMGNHVYGSREAPFDAHAACDQVIYVDNIGELATDAEDDGDGINLQCPRAMVRGNNVSGVKRHGIFVQILGGQSHIVPEAYVVDNRIAAAATGFAGTRCGVLVQPGTTACAPSILTARGNFGPGDHFNSAILIEAKLTDVAYAEAVGNRFSATLTRGVQVTAKTGAIVKSGLVAGNVAGGGSAEAFYLLGTDATGGDSLAGTMRNVTVRDNRSLGGTYALRLVNCRDVEYGQMLGTHTALTTSGLTTCRALGGPNTPAPVPSYTVAQLTTTLAQALPGTWVWASNGRKTGEGAGSGTGVPAISSGAGWKALDTASGLFIALVA